MKTVRTNSRNWDTDPKDGLNHNPIKFDPSTFKLIKWKNPSGFNVGNQVKYVGDFKLLQDKIGTVTEVVNRNLLICEFEGGIITDVNPSELISFRLNGFTDSSTPSGIEYVGGGQRFIAGVDVANGVDKSETVIYDKENNTILGKEWCFCENFSKNKMKLESACDYCKKEFYKWLETQEKAFSKPHPKSEYVSKKLPKVSLKEEKDIFIVEFEGEDTITQHLNDFTAPNWLDDNKFSMNIKFFGLIKTILDLKNIDFKIVK